MRTTSGAARLRAAAAAAALFAAAGCGGGTGSVSGEVTYDGQPVKTGYVSFTPADGKGTAAAGPITDGRYSVEKVPPGPKVVKVEAADKAGPSIQTTEELERFSRENKGKIGPSGIISSETIPPDAEGNNQPFEVKPGAQTLNLTLKRPAGKK
jgi:hypothetical protein